MKTVTLTCPFPTSPPRVTHNWSIAHAKILIRKKGESESEPITLTQKPKCDALNWQFYVLRVWASCAP